MNVNLDSIIESKAAKRRELSLKAVGEKLRIVEELAERSLATRNDSLVIVADEPWTIPATWSWRKMGDVARVVGGGTPRTDHPEYFGGDIPWITPADLSKYSQKTITRGSRNITALGLENSGAQLLPERAVLFSSRAPIGYVAIAANPVATNQGFKSFVLNEDLEPDFVYYYLSRARELAVALASGTTFLEISGKNAGRLPVPVPPRAEQQRIVAEIEKQFTRLDAGIALLKRVKTNLRCYRAAVLKAACKGQLVSAGPEAVASSTEEETAAQLLSRIVALRGGDRSLVRGTSAALPRLPERWTWTTTGELFDCIVPNRDKPKTFTGDIPWITLPAFSDQTKIGCAHSEHGLSKAEIKKYKARLIPAGSVVMSCIGRFGLAAVLGLDAVINQQLHAFVIPEFLPAEYFVYALRSQKSYMERIATSTTIAYLNKGNCNSIPIPLPPLAEQHRIVAEVERRLSVVDELEQIVEANLKRAKNLRQSILHRAFSGEL